MSDKGPTTFEAVGGEGVLTAAADKLYARVMDDPLLRLYFEDTDLASLKPRFSRYLAFLLGAPIPYDGPTMYQAHAGRQITDLAFDTFVETLLGVLAELRVSGAAMEQIREKLAELKNAIVDSFEFPGTYAYEKDRSQRAPKV